MMTAIHSPQAATTSARRSLFIAGSAAMLALAAMVFAPHAEARSNVSLSIGVGIPAGGYPAYQPQPVYVEQQPYYVQPQVIYQQPQVVYRQPAPIYYQPRPVFVQPAPVYYPQPVYYGRPHGYYRHGNGYGHGYGYGHGEGHREREGYFRGASPVYYGR